MKRFFQIIILIGILYFSYQGWLKFINGDQTSSLTEQPQQQEKKSLSDSFNQAVGSLQSTILSFVKDEQAIPASTVQLSDSEQEIVNELADYMQNRTSDFVVNIHGERQFISDGMEGWIDAALSTDDYTRYALQSYSYSIIGYSQYSEVSFKLSFRETDEQTEYVRSYVKDLLATNNISEMNDHEKIKWIHDWIVTHVQYDQSLSKYTAYEALTEGFAVCQGYALLGQMMLEEAGFEVNIAEGEVDTGNHAWNLVKLDGDWYHIDFTWDDPTGQAENEISYQYYLVSDNTLRKDHSWTKDYPVASIDYKDVLAEAIDSATGEQKQALQNFQKSLQLHWYEPEYTVSNKQALVDEILNMTSEKKQELSFRYMTTDTLITDLKDAFKATNMALSYNVQYKPFSEDGASLVTVNVTYH